MLEPRGMFKGEPSTLSILGGKDVLFTKGTQCTGWSRLQYARNGPLTTTSPPRRTMTVQLELFVSLTQPQRPLSADTINSITTKFLKDHNLKGFSAHSTRGAAVTALILLGVDPHVVCALGDWKNYDCFRVYYDRVRSCLPFTQILVPKHRHGDQPRLPL